MSLRDETSQDPVSIRRAGHKGRTPDTLVTLTSRRVDSVPAFFFPVGNFLAKVVACDALQERIDDQSAYLNIEMLVSAHHIVLNQRYFGSTDLSRQLAFL